MSVSKTYLIQGLDCANCAAKLENAIIKVDGIKTAGINFMGQKLSLEIHDGEVFENVMLKVKQVIQKIEPDVILVESGVDSRAAMVDNASGSCQCGHAHHDHDHDHEHKLKEHSHNHVEEHSANHDHSHEHGNVMDKKQMLKIVIGAAMFGVAMVASTSGILTLILFLISYLIIGGDILLRAIRNIAKGQVFDENFLMSIATIGAFIVGEYPEGVAVMLFYQVGELFQDFSVNRSRKSIASLMDIRPDYANLKRGDTIVTVSPQDVAVGDYIVVKAGEKFPLDGIVTEGVSMVDTSALTGESVPREVGVGNEVISGCINENGRLTVKVTKVYGESTVAKILDLVENASSKKANTENFITKFARIYTPFVVVIALLLAVVPPLIMEGQAFADWFYRGLIFLVISCPCALVISIPLSFFGGIGGASKCGILVKGSNYLEALANAEIVAFDKTGTLTKGIFKVTDIHGEGYTPQELLEACAYAESFSNHPIAKSILKAYQEECNKEINISLITNNEEIAGHGSKVEVNGKRILAGNIKLLKKEKISFHEAEAVGTVVYIAIDGNYAGYIVISDEIKEDAKKAVKLLERVGVKKTVMLTGDSKKVGEAVGKQLGITNVFAELLPVDKVDQMEELIKEKSEKGKLVFVGDGINDAPVLARADIGIAMGGLGSDAAIEAADVVIMTDEPSKIATAIKISRKTKQIVMQNIVFALGVKAIVLALGAAGVATMWEAVFADVGVSFIAILNAMRMLHVKNIA